MPVNGSTGPSLCGLLSTAQTSGWQEEVAKTEMRTRISTAAGNARGKRKTKNAPREFFHPVRLTIQTHIRAFGLIVDQDTRASIREKLNRRLGKFARSIERVSVRIQDVNGPRGGGADIFCRIKVVVRNLPSIVYENRDAAPEGAFNGAVTGTERAVRRTLERRRNKPIQKPPQITPVSPIGSNNEV